MEIIQIDGLVSEYSKIAEKCKEIKCRECNLSKPCQGGGFSCQLSEIYGGSPIEMTSRAAKIFKELVEEGKSA